MQKTFWKQNFFFQAFNPYLDDVVLAFESRSVELELDITLLSAVRGLEMLLKRDQNGMAFDFVNTSFVGDGVVDVTFDGNDAVAEPQTGTLFR